jgi:hypothetical protein
MGLRRRNLAFYLIALVLTVGALELVGLVVYAAVERSAFSFDQIARARAAAADSVPEGSPRVGRARGVIAHPYWGFARPPAPEAKPQDRSSRDAWNPRPEPLADLRDEVPARSVGEIHVAVFGGSVAARASVLVAAKLAKALGERRLLSGREIVTHVAAESAFKQPQQLTKLAYLLSLGAEFDVVVNLDGFNEVYLSELSLAGGTFPFFPAYWAGLTSGMEDPATLLRLGEIELERGRRAWWAEAASHPLVRWSVFANTTWLLIDRIQATSLDRARTELEESRREQPRSLRSQGPEYPLVGQGDLLSEVAEVWARSSLAMQALSEQSGAHYFHFLQPNQYLPGSKPMGDRELRLAYDASGPRPGAVAKGYPLLIERGRELLARGVSYHDLTMLFAEEEAPLYRDTCCHLNSDGNTLLVTAIVDVIAAHLASLEPDGAPPD